MNMKKFTKPVEPAFNKAMQSDSATCHALCVPHKDAPGCYAVDGGVISKGAYGNIFLSRA